MLGRDEAYDRMPYFFSDQYDVGMEYSGRATAGSRLVVRGDTARGSSSPSGSTTAASSPAMNVNVWDVTDPIQALIRDRTPVDERRCATRPSSWRISSPGRSARCRARSSARR